ncbi:hypothetical protein FNV43_RR13826 [Rhamnella rubrinervis]|uniref:Mediator complex subunit 15 KIX domain-containing protein n=1 Tax=Rhamnella rubrinervis TaxID=2594499 RepID=A0A8K0H1Q6_9ROSA|nr:hypothetical protein FNV43_RR13826 [Rhamnella rubrinervis]
MEDNSNKEVVVKTEPNKLHNPQNNDWRRHFAPHVREKIVHKFYALIKNQSPSSDPSYLNKAARIAAQSEEMVFRSAATKDDYLITMHEKLKVMENSHRRTIASSSGITKTSTVDAVEQRGQLFQQPSLQHQLLQPNNSSLFIDIDSGEAIEHQYSHQPIIRNQKRKQITGQQLNAAVFQQNQQFGHQHVGVSEKQKNSFCLQNASNSFQQPLVSSNNVTGLQQPENMAASQSNVLNFQPHHRSIGIPKLAELTDTRRKIQKISQPIQVHQQHNSEKQNIASQEGLPKALSQSAAVAETLLVADWHDQAYQQLHSLRGKCLPNLEILLVNTYKMYHQERDSVLSQQHKNNFRAVEKMIKFLLLTRSDFGNYSKEYFNYYWQAILRCHYNVLRTKSIPAQGAAQLQPPAAHSRIPLPQQRRNLKPQSNPISLVMESTPAPSPPSTVHQGMPNSHRNTMTLSLPGSSNTGNLLSPFQHDSPSSVCPSIAGVPQQITSFSQKMGVNAHDSATIPFQEQNQRYMRQSMRQPKHRQREAIEMDKPHTLMQSIHEGLNPHHVQPPAAPHLSTTTSPRIDNQNSLPVSKATMTLHSAIPPSVTAPPAPLTPSPSSQDIDEHYASVSTLSKPDHVQHPQMNAKVTESTNTDNGNQQSNTKKLKPIERLIRAVSSMTPLALNAAVNDISSVMNMADVIADTGVGCNSRAAVGEDLACTTRCSVRDSMISSACANKKKHNVSASSFDHETESSMFFISQRCEPEIIATPWITRH